MNCARTFPLGQRADLRSALVLVLLAMCAALPAAVPAFPGAEGFGAQSVGGRGGRVVAVTNLEDSGPGSLRAALMSTGPRIVVFRVGGTIRLTSRLALGAAQSFLTIAGQTAPGDGIQIRGFDIVLTGGIHDVVVRNLRLRPGATAPNHWSKHVIPPMDGIAVPELDIARGDTAIADGGSDTLAGTAAGSAAAGDYVLTNRGSVALAVTVPVTIADMRNCSASVSAQPEARVAAGGSSGLSVRVTPTAAGAWSFALAVTNSDGDENPYDWTVSGTAAPAPAPELDIARQGMAIVAGGADAISGAADTLTYLLSNRGNAPLALNAPVTVSGASNCSATVVTQPSATIAAGGSSELVVGVTPSAAGAWSFVLTVTSSDDENPYRWTVSGAESKTGGSSPIGSANGNGPGSTRGCGLGSGFTVVILAGGLALLLQRRRMR